MKRAELEELALAVEAKEAGLFGVDIITAHPLVAQRAYNKALEEIAELIRNWRVEDGREK